MRAEAESDVEYSAVDAERAIDQFDKAVREAGVTGPRNSVST